jgi:hypothetical protein
MNPLQGWASSDRLAALRRFAIAISVFNILGHTVFGFEQAWIQPLVGIGTAYGCEFLFECISCWQEGRKPRFSGGWRNVVDFLLSAHITGLAVSMLLYSNSRLMPIAFAAAVAIASKFLFRIPVQGGSRHLLNPSNFGIAATLLLFPWVGIAPPYHFSENVHGAGSTIIPLVIIGTGSLLNTKFTKRISVALGWGLGFFVQALIRYSFFDQPFLGALMPMTGVAFVLFTFYMVTDPATTPCMPRGQFIFGVSVGVVYGVLVMLHIVFGIFFALALVSVLRGLSLYARNFFEKTAFQGVTAQATMRLAKEMV